MNDTATSQPGASLLPSGTGTITTIHLVLILLVAIAAIAIIVVGIRRKRLRDQAARQVERHAREAGVAPPSVAPAPAPTPTPSAPPPPPPQVEAAPPEDTGSDPLAPDPLANEPIAAAAPLEASPATVAADPAPVPAAPADAAETSPADGPVTQLKGLGPKVAARLAELGITRIGQIAALDEDAAGALDAQLGAFAGRMTRDRWVEQARFLAAGDRAGFEAVFGRL